MQNKFLDEALSLIFSDFAKAYKHVADWPAVARNKILAQWHPGLRLVVFLLTAAQFFGGKSAPLKFARVPDRCCYCVSTLAALCTTHCVDDMICNDICIDRESCIICGRHLWRTFAILGGWDVPDEKYPIPSVAQRVIGVFTEAACNY